MRHLLLLVWHLRFWQQVGLLCGLLIGVGLFGMAAGVAMALVDVFWDVEAKE